MGSEMVCFGTLTNIPFPQLRNTAPRALPWPVASSPPQSRHLHVLTQLSYVSISSCAECAACPATTTITIVSRIRCTAMKLCLSHGHGMKSECLFRGSRGGHWKTRTRTTCSKLNACVRVSKPDFCNWNEDCSVSMALDTCCPVTACMSSNTRGSADAHTGCHTLYKFVVHCKIQCTVREIRTAERQFQSPHTAFDSRREASRFTWSSHRRKPPSSQNIQ